MHHAVGRGSAGLPLLPAGAGDVCDVGGDTLLCLEHEERAALLVAQTMPLQVQEGAPILRYSAGGLFRLFELAHAAVPSQPVTVFTAKQGLRVTFGDEPGRNGKPILGTLMRPLHLGVKGAGGQQPAGSAAAGSSPKSKAAHSANELDPNTVWWEVAWDSGKVNAWALGTSPSVSVLRVAGVVGFSAPPARVRRLGRPGDECVRVEAPVMYYPLPGVPELDRHMDVSLAVIPAWG